MSTRPVVSYDDITLPYDQPDPTQKQASTSTSFPHPPPAKKRKKGNNHNQKKQHWDEPRRSNTNGNNDAQNSQRAEFLRHANSNNARAQAQTQASAATTEFVVIAEEEVWGDGEGEYEYEEEEEEESRDLTHEEIWDDSALVDAWDSAMEEFRRYHGADTDWKTQPVKKSPLWYNVPVDPSKKPAQATAAAPAVVPHTDASTNGKVEEDEETDSRPINFDTFVPTHDASLPVPAAAEVDYTAASLIAGATVTQDEAFERALSATYWAGYWTAMYHARRGQVSPGAEASSSAKEAVNAAQADEEEDGMDVNDDEEVDDTGFVSTQR